MVLSQIFLQTSASCMSIRGALSSSTESRNLYILDSHFPDYYPCQLHAVMFVSEEFFSKGSFFIFLLILAPCCYLGNHHHLKMMQLLKHGLMFHPLRHCPVFSSHCSQVFLMLLPFCNSYSYQFLPYYQGLYTAGASVYLQL